MPKSIDLTASGYHLEGSDKSARHSAYTVPMGHDYIDQAIKDIVNGRIKFFETSVRIDHFSTTKPGTRVYYKYYIADYRDNNCINKKFSLSKNYPKMIKGRSNFDDKCLAAIEAITRESVYDLRGYYVDSKSRISDYVEIIDIRTEKKVASYRRVSILRISSEYKKSILDKTCPEDLKNNEYAANSITEYVFEDGSGNVASLK